MKTIPIFFLCLITVATASGQHHDFSWLIGTWQLKGKNVYEVWTRGANDQNLSGVSFHLTGADTTVTELISLEFVDGSFHYIPDIAGPQPPVDFKITSSERFSFTAENLQHDFPKKIHYKFIKTDASEIIEAAIEGDGKRIGYMFVKLK